MCSESARGDAQWQRFRLADQILEQALASRGAGCRAESRARSLARIGSQRELRDKKQIATDVSQRAVHSPGSIIEYSITHDPFDQPISHRFTVPGLNCYQGHNPGPYRPEYFVID